MKLYDNPVPPRKFVVHMKEVILAFNRLNQVGKKEVTFATLAKLDNYLRRCNTSNVKDEDVQLIIEALKVFILPLSIVPADEWRDEMLDLKKLHEFVAKEVTMSFGQLGLVGDKKLQEQLVMVLPLIEKLFKWQHELPDLLLMCSIFFDSAKDDEFEEQLGDNFYQMACILDMERMERIDYFFDYDP